MSFILTIRELQGHEVRSIKCPQCNKGTFRFICNKIGRQAGHHKTSLICNVCNAMLHPDVFHFIDKDVFYKEEKTNYFMDWDRTLPLMFT